MKLRGHFSKKARFHGYFAKDYLYKKRFSTLTVASLAHAYAATAGGALLLDQKSDDLFSHHPLVHSHIRHILPPTTILPCDYAKHILVREHLQLNEVPWDFDGESKPPIWMS